MSSTATDAIPTEHISELDSELRHLWDRSHEAEYTAALLCLHLNGLNVEIKIVLGG